jgi:hypothetical protein
MKRRKTTVYNMPQYYPGPYPGSYPGSYPGPSVAPSVVKKFIGEFVNMTIRDVNGHEQNVFGFIHVVARIPGSPANATVEYIDLNKSHPFRLTYTTSNDIVQIQKAY